MGGSWGFVGVRTSVDIQRFTTESCARNRGKRVIGLDFWASFGRFWLVSARFGSVSARLRSVLSDILRLDQYRARIGQDVRASGAMSAVVRMVHAIRVRRWRISLRSTWGSWGSPMVRHGRTLINRSPKPRESFPWAFLILPHPHTPTPPSPPLPASFSGAFLSHPLLRFGIESAATLNNVLVTTLACTPQRGDDGGA